MILLLTINIFTVLMLSSCIEATTYYNQAKGPLPSFEDPTNIPHDEYIGKFLNTSEDGCLYVSLGKFGTFQSSTIFPLFFFLFSRAQLFKANDVVSKRFVKIYNE